MLEEKTMIKLHNHSTPTNPGVFVIETVPYEKKFILLAKKDKLITPSGAIPLDENSHTIGDIMKLCIKYNCYGWRWKGETKIPFPPGSIGDEGSWLKEIGQYLSYKKLVRCQKK